MNVRNIQNWIVHHLTADFHNLCEAQNERNPFMHQKKFMLNDRKRICDQARFSQKGCSGSSQCYKL